VKSLVDITYHIIYGLDRIYTRLRTARWPHCPPFRTLHGQAVSDRPHDTPSWAGTRRVPGNRSLPWWKTAFRTVRFSSDRRRRGRRVRRISAKTRGILRRIVV